MESRKAKQIIYSAGYVLFFALLLSGAYFIWFRPAPSCFDNKKNQNETGVDCGGQCAPCALKNLLPIQSDWIKYFPTDHQTIIAAEIKNPNLDYGASKLNYILTINGKDANPIKTISGDSLIYAGEIKYIIEPVDIAASDIGSSKIDFSAPSWQSKRDFPAPQIQTRAVETKSGENGGGPTVTGFIKNNNAFGLSKLKMIGLLFSPQNILVHASKTELENFAAFEEKRFQINFPKNISLTTAPASSPAFTFNQNLTVGSKGGDVSELQKFLKTRGFWDRDVSDYFGELTREALIKYQKQIGVSPANGYLGVKTRNYINAELSREASRQIFQNRADSSKTKVYVEAIR